MPPKISVIVCTYNRADLLEENLQSLTEVSHDMHDFEVLIIDNNSTDDTNQVAQRFADQYSNLRVVVEKEQGLSYARNRGYREARADWVTYVDDDAKVAKNYITRALWVIDNKPYLFFGGVYLPWYRYGQPRWFKDQYASNKMTYTDITVMTGDESVSGGVMVIKKELLAKYNGFSIELGMKGNKVAYGEETELQLRMRADGIQIAYDPELIIYHVVAPYKLNVDWFFKAAFATGRDMVKMNEKKVSGVQLIGVLIVLLGMLFVHLLLYTPKLLQRDYYLENWLIDVFKKITKRVGMLYTGLLEERE